MEFFNTVKEWFQARATEVTTWDGISILILSGAVLLASPFVKYIAMAGIVYGGYRVLQKEGVIKK